MRTMRTLFIKTVNLFKHDGIAVELSVLNKLKARRHPESVFDIGYCDMGVTKFIR